MARARSLGRADLLQRALLAHGLALEAAGRVAEAVETLDEVAALDAVGLTRIRGCIALCRCTRESGDLAHAIERGEEARAWISAAGLEGTDEAVQLTVTLAAAYFERGDVAFATRLCRDAVSRAEATGSPTARASAYWNASMVLAESGDVAAALPMAERALSLLGEGSDARNVARLRCMLATLQLASDPPDLDAAEENLALGGAQMLESSASTVDLARNDVTLARLHLLRDDAAGADSAARAHASAEAEAPLLAADALSVLGQARRQLGDAAGAVASYRGPCSSSPRSAPTGARLGSGTTSERSWRPAARPRRRSTPSGAPPSRPGCAARWQCEPRERRARPLIPLTPPDYTPDPT